MNQLRKLKGLQAQVRRTIENCQTVSSDKYGVAPKMKILYDLESVRTLGQANYRSKSIRLNKHLLLEYGKAYIDDVVVHEYAHFVMNDLQQAGKFRRRPQPHGREFKAMCSYFGTCGKASTTLFADSVWLKAKRETLNRTKKFVEYECGCMTHEMSTIKHNKIRRGASYTCRKCKQRLSVKD